MDYDFDLKRKPQHWSTIITLECSSVGLIFYYLVHFEKNKRLFWTHCGLCSSVGIATDYGLDGPGIESRWDEIFCTCPDRPWGPSSLLYNEYRVFPGGKERPGRDADPSPPSSTVVKKE